MRAVTGSVLGVVLGVFLYGPVQAQEKEEAPPVPEAPGTEKAMKLAKLGDGFAGEGRLGEAIESYRKALDLVPIWTEARFSLGRLEFAKGQRHFLAHLAAAKQAEKVLESGDPKEAEQFKKESEEQRSAGESLLREAAANLRIVAAMKGSPRLQAESSLQLGHISAIFEKWQDAKDHYVKAGEIYEKAHGSKPGDPALKKIRQAIKLMDEEIKKQGTDGKAGGGKKGTDQAPVR